jgi:hypothetical protein
VKSPTLSFQELLRRLGVGGGGVGLEIIEAAQPVISVGSLDALVPILPPATTVVGGLVAGGGTGPTAASCQIASSSGVGFSLEVHFFQNVAGEHRWGISTTGAELLSDFVTTVTPTPMVVGGPTGDVGSAAVMLLGHASRAGITPVFPAGRNTTASEQVISVFVPANRTFEFTSTTSSAVLQGYAILVDVPTA